TPGSRCHALLMMRCRKCRCSALLKGFFRNMLFHYGLNLPILKCTLKGVYDNAPDSCLSPSALCLLPNFVSIAFRSSKQRTEPSPFCSLCATLAPFAFDYNGKRDRNYAYSLH